ncbi:MAG TPA: hypothetical protein VND98_05055, partial [Solirubrobacterales bacterium]|nr:hypothetical protein [Solirubrobacterales bacterium]
MRLAAGFARALAIAFGLLPLWAVPAAASGSDFTWSGAPPPNNGLFSVCKTWSNPYNWVGGVAPSGSVGTLTFPYIGGGPESGCHYTENDLVGISVNALDITGGLETTAYKIEGNQIPLGEGGITVTPSIYAQGWTETDIGAPLLLSAPQTWTINGSKYVGWLNLHDNVSGEASALQVKLNNGNLAVRGADLESGPLSISGQGSVYLGASLGAYLIGALNGNDGNPVSIGAGAILFDENTNIAVDKNAYDIGALTLAEGGLLELGQPEYNASVTLPVNGGVSFRPTSQLALLDNSQITATGPVNLGGASLHIQDGTTLIN